MAGQTASTGTVTITGVNNDVVAADKTVQGEGNAASNTVGISGPADVTLTLEDDDEPPLEPPLEPLNFLATGGDGLAVLTWEPPLDDGGTRIAGYEYRHAAGDSGPAGAAWHSAGTELTATVDGLANGETYAFEVRALNVVGAGPAARTSAVPATVPEAPVRLTAAPGDEQVALAWEAPASDGGAEIIEYEYRFAAGPNPPLDAAWRSAGLDLGETVTGLANGEVYAFEVRAVNGVGAGPAASVVAELPDLNRFILAGWLSRFGRTVGTHVTDAVGERLRAAPGQASHVTVGGYRLPLRKRQPGEAESAAAPLTALAPGQAGLALGPDTPRPELGNTDPWLGQPRTAGLPAVRLRDVLLGSSFRLNLGATDPAGSVLSLTAWGRVAGTQFDGRDELLTIDGDVLTGTAGVDGTWDRWLAGVAMSHSWGDGSFTLADPGADGRGEVAQTLTSIHPYLRYAVTDRLDVWGLLGYGWGELKLKPANAASLETDTEFLMGSIGSRGILLPAPETGGFELATRTDAMFTRTTSDAVSAPADRGGNLAGAAGAAHRVRLVLEGTREVTWPEGQRVTPAVEIGLRHDWGDAETGFGLELGGRVQYADPGHGLTIEAAVRGLLAHEDNDYEEWGASGTIRIDPGPMGQGLALTLTPAWGAASSGVDGLWSRQTTAGLAQIGAGIPAGRLNAEVGYGFAAFDTGLLTPYAGAVLADGAARTYRLGTRLLLTGRGTTGLAITLEGQRQEPVGQQPLNQALQLQATWGF